MAVRNFWFEADVDGYHTQLSGGPRAKDGGMDIVLYQREDGEIYTAMKIFCRADGPNLKTEIWIGGKKTDLKIETMR